MSTASWAKRIGALLANIQSAVDDALQFCFRGLKKAGSTEDEVYDPEGGTVEEKLKRGAKTAAKFVGELGDSYYETYEELKKKKD